MESLPTELILKIANLTSSVADIYNLSRSSKELYSIINFESLNVDRFDKRNYNILIKYLSESKKYQNVENNLRNSKYNISIQKSKEAILINNPEISIKKQPINCTNNKIAKRSTTKNNYKIKKTIKMPNNLVLSQGDFGYSMIQNDDENLVSVGGLKYLNNKFIYRVLDIPQQQNESDIRVWHELINPNDKFENLETIFIDSMVIKYIRNTSYNYYFDNSSVIIKSIRCIKTHKLWRFDQNSSRNQVIISDINRAAELIKIYHNKLYIINLFNEDNDESVNIPKVSLDVFTFSLTPISYCDKFWSKDLTNLLKDSKYHQSLNLNTKYVFINGYKSQYSSSSTTESKTTSTNIVLDRRLRGELIGYLPINYFVSNHQEGNKTSMVLSSSHIYFITNSSIVIKSIREIMKYLTPSPENVYNIYNSPEDKKDHDQIVNLKEMQPELRSSRYISTKISSDEQFIMVTYHNISKNKPFVILINNNNNSISSYVEPSNNNKSSRYGYDSKLIGSWCVDSNGNVYCISESYFEKIWKFIENDHEHIIHDQLIGFQQLEKKSDINNQQEGLSNWLALSL